jgi:hypothetical protein
MTRLTKLPADDAFKARLKSHGFSFDDPDRRYPTRNDFPVQVLNLRSKNNRGNAALLLGDRNGRHGADRSRVLPWLTPLAGLLGWPERAAAQDHHLSIVTRASEIAPNGFDLGILLDTLLQMDLSHPLWGFAFGGAVLMTQTVGILQRRAILKASVAQMVTDQPDLFPDTLPEEPSASGTFSWEVDAATRQGQVRRENQDAQFVIRFADGSVVLVICDGAGGVGGGREAAHSAVETIGATLRRLWDEHQNLSGDDLDTAIEAARKAAKDRRLEGVTTAILVHLDEDRMQFATLGDGAIAVVWPDGMVGAVQVPHHTFGQPSNVIDAYIGGDCTAPARTGSLRLEPGVIVLAMTDGVSDLFGFEDFARDRQEFRTMTGLADHLLAYLEAARDPDTGAWLHHDNMTLAMARLCKESGDDQTS